MPLIIAAPGEGARAGCRPGPWSWSTSTRRWRTSPGSSRRGTSHGDEPEAAARRPGGRVGSAGVHPGLARRVPRPLRPHRALALHRVGRRQEGRRAVRPRRRPARVQQPGGRPRARRRRQGDASPGAGELAGRLVLEFARRAAGRAEEVLRPGDGHTGRSRPMNVSTAGSAAFSLLLLAATARAEAPRADPTGPTSSG